MSLSDCTITYLPLPQRLGDRFLMRYLTNSFGDHDLNRTDILSLTASVFPDLLASTIKLRDRNVAPFF